MSRQHRVPGTTSRPRVRLIPLPSLALGAAPTTAEIVAAAATLPAIREELREEPGRLAAVDQLVASDREAAKRLAEAAVVFGFTNVEVRGQRAKEAALAAGIAMLRTVEARCPHVPWPPTFTGPRIVVSLASRAAVCGRPACGAAMRARWYDDRCCELCEQAADTFTPFVATLGPCLITMELCEACSVFMRGVEAAA